MPVKAELAFDVCWEVYRGAREVLETKRGLSTLDWKEATKFLWRPDIRLPRPRAVRKCAAFSRLERTQLSELVGGDSSPLRQGAAAARHVPPAKVFCECRLVG
jgi:hypothetical protein